MLDRKDATHPQDRHEVFATCRAFAKLRKVQHSLHVLFDSRRKGERWLRQGLKTNASVLCAYETWEY